MRDLSGTRDFFGRQGNESSARCLCSLFFSPGDVCARQRGFHTMDLPETIRKRLEDFSRNVLFDQSRTQPLSKEHDTFLAHGKLKMQLA